MVGDGRGKRLLAESSASLFALWTSNSAGGLNRTVTENQRLYAAIGYEEIGRGTEAGYERVFMRKRLTC